MITITDLSARIAGRLLIDHASVALPAGTKAGLVGKNGAGKSTLFKIITGDMASESGFVSIPKNARIGQVAQEAPGTEEPLIEIVLAADKERDGAAGRGRDRDRSAPDRRNPDAARRYRRPFGRSARREHPRRASASTRTAQLRAGLELLRRLAHARGARRRAVFRARPAAARRADQLSRPRRHAVARELYPPLSAHGHHHQPRPRPAEQGGQLDRPSRPAEAHLLSRRLRPVRAPDAPRPTSCRRRRRPRTTRRASTCRASSTASRPRPPRPARRRAASRRWSAWARLRR